MSREGFDSWWRASKYCQVAMAEHRQIALDAWNAALASPPAAVAVTDDTARLDYIERERLNVSPLDGGGWDVTAFDCGDSHETLLASRTTIRAAIDEAVALTTSSAQSAGGSTSKSQLKRIALEQGASVHETPESIHVAADVHRKAPSGVGGGE